MIEARVFQDGTVAQSQERRYFQRLPLAVQIELRPKESAVPIRLKTADISVGGCYVEMSLTLEPGAVLDITLWLDQEKLPLEGRVVTKHPHFGNGIEFTGVTSESETRLRTFLEKAENCRVI